MLNPTICATTFVQGIIGIDDGNLHETRQRGEDLAYSESLRILVTRGQYNSKWCERC